MIRNPTRTSAHVQSMSFASEESIRNPSPVAVEFDAPRTVTDLARNPRQPDGSPAVPSVYTP